MVEPWSNLLDGLRKAGSSTGAIIEVVASGVPAGLGAPIYGKLDADLARAMMSINAVKGVEIGAGFAAAALSGEENADEMRMGNDGVEFVSNNAGGILGGISTGQDIVVRFAVKPTSSILTPRHTVDTVGRRDRDLHQGPPRSLRRHPRRAGRRSDDGDRAGGPSAAPSRAVRVDKPYPFYRRNTPTNSRCADQGNWSMGRRRSRRKPPSMRSRASRAKLRGSQET